MQERHSNNSQYFEEQMQTTFKHVIPFVNEVKPINNETRVLEIGCGEGGNLVPFVEMECRVIVGVDLSERKIKIAQDYFDEIALGDRVRLLCEDIYDSTSLQTYDFIFLRDVIEHIHDQEKFMAYVKQYLNPGGVIFFGFPPWYNPFGGHQQVLKSRVLSKLPYFHLLPKFLYKGILMLFREPKVKIEGLMEVRETGISLERFESIVEKTGYKIDKKTWWIFNPNYEIKFGLKPRKQFKFIAAIPFIRNFFTTCGYYVISAK